MLNDFMPVSHEFGSKEHNNLITIVPLADAHYGSPEFDEVMWHRTIKRIQDDPHCYCVLVGDLIDNGLKNSLTNVYDATCSPMKQKEWLYDELKPIADKILGAVGGNHERRTSKEVDQDPLYDVLVRLGKEDVYRKNICFMHIKIMYTFKGKPKMRVSFAIALTHGNGGGQYIGSSANKVQNFGMAIEGIDCLITAHTHKPVTFPVSKIIFSNGSVTKKQFVVAVASSFLNYGGYAVQKLMQPTAHTITEVLLKYTCDTTEIKVLQ